MTTGEQGLPRAPLLSAGSLVLGNLLPIWAVWAGHMSVGDVFVVYWLENVAVWAITIVKVASARGEATPSRATMTVNGRPVDQTNPTAMAFFFAFHYGIFTLVHGVFAFVLAFMAGGRLHPLSWLLAGLALALSHLASLWINWYAGGERWRVSPVTAMWQPYPRMLVLHVAVILAFFFVLPSGDGSVPGTSSPTGVTQLVPVLILFGLKTVVDLALHLRERLRSGSASLSLGA